MASAPPDPNPDSPPIDDPAPARENIEDPSPGSQPEAPGPDDAGLPGGTTGTGGTNHPQDD